MTCKACDKARANWPSGEYRNGCIGCAARAVSQEPAHFEAYQAQKYTPRYMEVLHTVFGDQWQEGHAEVRRWSELLRGNKDSQPRAIA